MPLTQQRVWGGLSLRGPRFSQSSAPAEPASFFRRSGCERQVGQLRQRTAVQPRVLPEDPETTVPPPGSVGAMNDAGEAPLLPAKGKPGGAGGLWGLSCASEARLRGRAGAGTRGDGEGGAFWVGWSGPEGGSIVGEDAGEGLLRCYGHLGMLLPS